MCFRISRRANAKITEAPVLKPLVPLGVFLAGNVGLPPAEAALRTYIMRMREQGWDTSALLAAFERCGMQLSPQVIPNLELRKEMKEELRKEMKEDRHVQLAPQVCLNSGLIRREDRQVVQYVLQYAIYPPRVLCRHTSFLL